MKVRFAFMLETGIDLQRSAPNTRENARIRATFFPHCRELCDDYESDFEIDPRHLVSGWTIQWIYEKTQKIYFFDHFNTSFEHSRIKNKVSFKMDTVVIVLIDLNWSNYEEQLSNFIVQNQIKTIEKDIII